MTLQATIVTPTYNRSRQLERVLTALGKQDALGQFDVIVVDDGSSDDTSTVLNRIWPFPLTAHRQENAGPGAARNLAIQHAKGTTIIFVDDDVIPAPDLIRQHLDAQGVEASVVIGRLLSPQDRQPAWAEWECRTVERQYADMQAGYFEPTPRQFYTANASVPRAALVKAGMFDARYRRAEDVELAYRLQDLGLSFTFLPAAIVEHDTPRAFDAWRSIATQYGRYDVLMWRGGRTHILRNISWEFSCQRNPATRAIARLTVGRPNLIGLLEKSGGLAVRMLSKTGPRWLTLATCGAYFNALYLDGACVELGLGRRGFWQLLHQELNDVEQPIQAALGS